jgi:hypothetical protein
MMNRNAVLEGANAKVRDFRLKIGALVHGISKFSHIRAPGVSSVQVVRL